MLDRIFKPKNFFNERWEFVKDDRLPDIEDFDASRIELVTVLLENETSVSGEERLKRLAAIDSKKCGFEKFLHLWKNQTEIPGWWKERNPDGGVRYVTFDREEDVLTAPHRSRCVLCLYWNGSVWCWGICWLCNDCNSQYLSAVIPD